MVESVYLEVICSSGLFQVWQMPQSKPRARVKPNGKVLVKCSSFRQTFNIFAKGFFHFA